VTITTGLVDTSTIPQLLRLITDKRLDPTILVTHRLGIADTMQAYDVFADAATTDALKVVLTGNTVATGPIEETAATVGRNGGLPRHLVHG
jgi:alcohol dehydrogenase